VRARAATLATLGTVAWAGCGGGDPEPERPAAEPDHVIPARPLAAGPRLVEPAPEWVRAFCAEVVRRSELGCPGVVPAGFTALDLPQEQPTARGYVLAAIGWQIRGGAARRGPPLAAARIATGGDGTLTLRWGRYVIATDGRASERLERQIRAVAAGMTRG
ncbi:MAG TPA: hypothetical protein VGW10_10180, partial [Solirubrobacteraceae bacterium]|nr:hypothetical protein [Solirubrobacteraceae bacterium]